MRVLAVGAHPDDLELFCGGTLAKYAQRGDEVFMAIATNGEAGSAVHGKQEIANIRYREAKESAAVIGATLIWMGYPDEFLFSNEETRLRFIDLIREVKPDVIFGHYPEDLYNPDHSTAGQILNDVAIMVTVPNIKTGHPPCDKIVPMYFTESHCGVNFLPDEYVDISSTIEIKKTMMSKHQSQVAWLENQYDMTPLDFIEITGRYRGLQAGVKYAEVFKRVRAWPREFPGSLLPHD
ncbi:MAG: PIG-L family deacetylase [Firmicutes bacterium]|nr:PIG-L family deacetylase [Bacillota bacterium]